MFPDRPTIHFDAWVETEWGRPPGISNDGTCRYSSIDSEPQAFLRGVAMMRALSALFFASLFVAGLGVGEIVAQATPSMESAAAGDRLPDYPTNLVSGDGPSWRSRFWNAVGGAALGAGVGYFASQLASGDWEEGQITRHRQEWAVVGGSIGLAAGLTFPFFGRGVSLAPSVSSNPRVMITALEVAESSASTAYEAVRILRPNWLSSRRPHLLADPSCGALDRVCAPIRVERLKVYLDGHRLGGPENLMDIGARNIETIRFFSAAEAVARWGAGHSQGAILVSTIG